MITHKRITYILLAAIAALIAVFTVLFCSMPVSAAHAESDVVSDVLSDLQSDSTFDISKYPALSPDNTLYVKDDPYYKIKVIQIAETTDGELLIYTYQPSGSEMDFKASSINISTEINDSLKYFNYKLIFCNSSGTLYKYKVADFEVKKDALRYYDITNILRPYKMGLDNQLDFDNTSSEVPNTVGQRWTACTVNGVVSYNYIFQETIEITDKFVGFCRYSDGVYGYETYGAVDSHFVAFDTDRSMDYLYEADVYFVHQSYDERYGMSIETTFGDPVEEYAYLKSENKIEHTGAGLFAATYKWNEIETVEQFISENNVRQNVYTGAIIGVDVANKITDEGMRALQGKKWVLRFYQTRYGQYSISGGGMIPVSHYYKEIVGDVMILRLKFERDGVVYNLGVVDNKQTGSDNPVNEEEIIVVPGAVFNFFNPNKWWSWLKWVLIIAALILLLIVLAPVLPYILRALVWLICLPVKAIAAVIKAIKNVSKSRKDKKAQKAVVGQAVTPDGRQIKVRYNMDEGGTSGGGGTTRHDSNSGNGNKNKGTKRKWNRTHEFKRKKSTPNKVGHPVYVYGKSGENSKYLVFTHTPEVGKEENYEKLDHNIDPDKDGTDENSYVKKQYEIDRSDNLREPDKKYRIHEDDREKIKKYKK